MIAARRSSMRENAMKANWLLAGAALGLSLTTAATSHAQLTGQTIRIGIGGPLTTGSASFGLEMRKAVELAVADKNAAGGIGGAKLEAIALDDEANAQKGEAVAGTFCATSHLLCVVGHVNSGVTNAASKGYHKSGLAAVTPN